MSAPKRVPDQHVLDTRKRREGNMMAVAEDLDLQAKMLQDLTERSILQAFFEEAFAEWLKGKLA